MKTLRYARGMAMGLLAATLLAACQSNEDNHAQTMMDSKTPEETANDNTQSSSEEGTATSEDSNDEAEQQEPEQDPVEAIARYDELSEPDQAVLAAYALFDNVGDQSFEYDEYPIPNFNRSEDIGTLYYYIEDNDLYMIMMRDAGAFNMMAHAQITDDGVVPIQFTGYTSPDNAYESEENIPLFSAYGENNWLPNQDLIPKDELWGASHERLEAYHDDGKRIISNRNAYLEFVTSLLPDDYGLVSLDDAWTDEELIYAAQLENYPIDDDDIKGVLSLGAIIRPVEGGYVADGAQYHLDDYYSFDGDTITSELREPTGKMTYENDERTSTHSISELKEKYAPYKDQLNFVSAYSEVGEQASRARMQASEEANDTGNYAGASSLKNL